MRILVADDLPESVSALEAMLSAHPDVRIVSRAFTLESLRNQVKALRPDLVFLDLCFPCGNSMETIPAIKQAGARIIIISSFDKWAVDAFAHSVDDYILKPVRPERLKQSLDRIRQQEAEAAALARPLIVNSAGILRRVEPHLIVRMFTHGNTTEIQMIGGRQFRTHEPLYKIMDRLSGTSYLIQINRTTAVNVSAVQEAAPVGNGQLHLALDDGSVVICSRRRAQEVRKALRGD